jgi:antitoxin component YwqK of YwqJK toxin-antitoxin module
MMAMINDKQEGVKQGFWVEFEDSERWTGFYQDGKKTGSWSYYEGQQLMKTLRYVDGLKQGHGYKFDPEGKLRLAVEFDKDRIHGKVRFFSSDGKLIAVYGYIYDKLSTVDLYVLHDESPPKAKTYLPEF